MAQQGPLLLLGSRKHDEPSGILLLSLMLPHLSTNTPGDAEPAWPQGIWICWGSDEPARCECVWSTPCQHHSESQETSDLFQLTEMREKDQDVLPLWAPLSCLTSATAQCSHPRLLYFSLVLSRVTLWTAFGFLLKDTTQQRTCFVSLKLVLNSKGVLFFFCFPFSGESFHH